MPNVFTCGAVLMAISATPTAIAKPSFRTSSVGDAQAPLTKPPNSEFPEVPVANWTYNRPRNASGNCNFAAYKQCDSRWKDEELGTSSQTICSAGCAMSSVAMYVTTRGHSVTPHDLNQWLKEHGGYASGDLIIWGTVDSFGLSYQGQESGISVDTLAAGLNACHGIIANVRDGSHWVLLTEHVSGDTFRVHDPGFDQDTYTTSEMGVFAVYH